MSPSNRLALVFCILLGVAAPILALEIAVRSGLFTPAPRGSDRPLKYYLAKNSGNERDYPHTEAKAPDTFRIVTVGDSFTFGDYLQFDDTYSKRLERWLNLNDIPQKVEVINYSKPGYSSFDEVALVRSAVTALSPDLILLQFTLNDPELKPYRDTHRDDGKNSILNSALVRHWKGLEFVLTRLKAWSSRRDFNEYYGKLFDDPETWNRCVQSIAKMKTMADGRSVPFAAVIFPLFEYPMDDSYPFIRFHKKIQDKLTELKIPWLDLFDAYRGLSPDRLEVIPGQNGHPNEIANRIAAERIYGWLFTQNLVPKSFFAERESKFRNIYNPLRIMKGQAAAAAKADDSDSMPGSSQSEDQGGESNTESSGSTS